MNVFEELEPEKRKYAENVWDIIKNRRAMRWVYSYEEEPVSKAFLEQIIDAGCQAPSPENYQPWEFVIVTDLEQRKAIGRLGKIFCKYMFGGGQISWKEVATWRFGYMQKPHAIGLSTALMGTGWLMEYIEKSVVVVIACRSGLVGAKHFTTIVPITAQQLASRMAMGCAFMAAQNMMLMAHALGVGSCYFNFPMSSPAAESKIAEMCNITYPEFTIIGFVSLAWPLFPRDRGPDRSPPKKKAWHNSIGNAWENFKEE
ncbi:MAG TPA: nitroreductase family protein [Candidatus Deferrimicrobium sp.]|nr:nitroreductase family protein [Candidatus Deferrimicrobium sp.]